MCTPMAVMLIGTAVSAAGTIQQGQQQSAIDSHNAQVASQQATAATQRGAVAEQAQDVQTQQFMSSQVAKAAGAGVDVNSQSTENVLDQTATMGRLSALNTRDNAAMTAWSYTNQSNVFGVQAGMASEMGLVGGAGTALTGFGNAYYQNARLNRNADQNPYVN